MKLMSNEYKDWLNDQILLTRKEKIEEDLHYELDHNYKNDFSQFIIDTLAILVDMAKEQELC